MVAVVAEKYLAAENVLEEEEESLGTMKDLAMGVHRFWRGRRGWKRVGLILSKRELAGQVVSRELQL